MNTPKTLVVVGHPDLEHSKVNKAWTEALLPLQSESLRVHLLSSSLQPQGGHFDIEREQALVSQYDRIILQFPLYWYMVPSIMKEWLDTVWCEGWCYGEGGTQLEGKLIEVATSCGAPQSVFTPTPSSPHLPTLEDYLLFLRGTADFVRAKAGRVFAFYGAEMPDAPSRLPSNVKAYVDFVCLPPDEKR